MRRLLRWLFQRLFSLRATHLERLRFDGPTVIMPNHVSFLDAVLLYAYLPATVCFVVNTEIAANRWVALALRFCRHVEIEPRNPYALRTVIAMVRESVPVVLFPEGRITVTGSLMKMYTGAAMVAWKTAAQIFPVILRGPEFSRFSRVQDKVRARWFPTIQLYVDSPRRLTADVTLSFRVQKEALGDQLLSLMQQTLFSARREAYQGMDFYDRLLKSARLYGMGKVIARDLTRTMTYRQLLTAIQALSVKLAEVLGSESVAGVLMPNAVAHVTLLFALFRLGKTPAVFNFSTGTKNLVDCAANAGVRTVFTSRAFVERAGLAELTQRLAESYRIVYLEDLGARIGFADKLAAVWQTCLEHKGQGSPSSRIILFTSGTEGRPKGVVLSHDAILSNIDQASSLIDYTPADRMLNALPMFHSFGLMAGTLLPIFGGVELFLYPSPLHYRLVPEVVYDFNATLMLGTPTFLAGYGKRAHAYDFRSIRHILAGGEKLSAAVRELWHDKFGIRILEGYGITETGPVLALNTPLAHRSGTVGRFMPGIEWRIEPVEGIERGGNLFVRGPNLMDGYLLYERGFQPQTGWFSTGDVVAVDPAGFVQIQARLKRFAKIAGEMINLQVVEEAAAACFAGGIHAVLAVADGRKGERIILFTTAKVADRKTIREYLLAEGHSGLYAPSELVRLEKMPLLGSGKPDYMTLQRQAAQLVAENPS